MDINQWLWPKYARTYDKLLHSPLYQDLTDEVIQSLNLETASSFLDAGCGTGNLEKKIASRCFRSLQQMNAIDSSPEMLDIAIEKVKGVHFEQADLNHKLIYPDNSFDRIAMINVLYALSDPEFTLAEMCRILKPDGIAVIVNPCKGSSILKLVRANLKRIDPGKKLAFCLRMFLLLCMNMVIAAAARSGYYHFWGKEKWEEILPQKGFIGRSIFPTYADQAYMVVAEKKIT